MIIECSAHLLYTPASIVDLLAETIETNTNPCSDTGIKTDCFADSVAMNPTYREHYPPPPMFHEFPIICLL